MITHDKWNKILGTATIIIGIIVSIESSFGLFAYPPLWIGYGILILISLWFIFRKVQAQKFLGSQEPTPNKLENETTLSQLRVDLDRLPEPTTQLVGRETELAQLDEAFKDPKKAIVAMIAGGGVGKSALIWEWFRGLSFFSKNSNLENILNPNMARQLVYLPGHFIAKIHIKS
ncbi:MAG: hypothetical protein DRQ41_09540 [Gammaproteobacteria bacterium]|nr:MAG: hypothetical protein DRQ41_09540 [Gammaproteobacteria bacterium]